MHNQLDLTFRRFPDVAEHVEAAFNTYHANNPRVYDLFRDYCHRVRRSGRTHYGAKAIMERIRWELEIERGDDFKVNNNYASCYARLLAMNEPEFSSFFETRAHHVH